MIDIWLQVSLQLAPLMNKIDTLKNEIIGLKLLITEKEKQIEKLTKEKTPPPWPFPTLGSKTEDS